jgi:ubiquinone/menaquinone biosynthesis C-methylase UbiE
MDSKQRATATYQAAADHYDEPPLSFWDRFGRRTVERAGLSPGEAVLDACCGTGASALPAAEIVGQSGRVLAVDLAENQLARGRRKAAQRGLSNIEFRCADIEHLDPAEGPFDAVICVFGIFFLPDMVASLERLGRLVKPGAAIAATTWGPDLFEPANTVFWDSVRAFRPDLYKSFNPWDQIDTPDKLRDLFARAGLAGPECHSEPGTHAIAQPEDWWTIAMGSGYRGTIDQLTPEAAASVRDRCRSFLQTQREMELQTNVVYGVARRRS